jgi:hypothetical protein
MLAEVVPEGDERSIASVGFHDMFPRLAVLAVPCEEANRTDLATFRAAVDGCPPGISACQGDLTALYAYVGLPIRSAITLNDVSKELYRKVRAAFTSGHQAA